MLFVGNGQAHADDFSAFGSGLSGLHTKCESINWVGDSTSVLMLHDGNGTVDTSSDDSPLGKALAATGVKTIHYDIAVGRSVTTPGNGSSTGEQAMQALASSNGSRNCDVYAGGTNDAAMLSSQDDAATRIRQIAGTGRTIPLVITTVAVAAGGSNTGLTNDKTAMWNAAVKQLLPAHNVIDWSAKVSPGDFAGDGMHYTNEGSAKRAELSARVLAVDPGLGS